jgi:hypothetical protein
LQFEENSSDLILALKRSLFIFTLMHPVFMSIAAIGYLPALAVAWGWWRQRQILNGGATTTAKVMRTRRRWPQQSKPIETVEIHFTSTCGKHEVTGSFTAKIGRFKEGQTVTVFHHIRNPDRYIIDKKRYFGLWLTLALIPGIALTIACLHWQQQLITE